MTDTPQNPEAPRDSASTSGAASTKSTASIGYLDGVAGTDLARAYKDALLDALRIEPGQHVLDVGCGPATDLPALAAAVGAGGRVVGVDQDPEMVATARARTAGHAVVEVLHGDAQRLPLESASIDRARVDRVLMHVARPEEVLAGLHRVLRPGGLLTLAEPDWDTLAVDHPDLGIARAFTRYVAHRAARNQAIGRRLPRLAAEAGFELREVRNPAVVLTDFDTAETILGVRRSAARAVAAGYLDAAAARSWTEHLTTTRSFFATCSFITVLAQARS
jgi:ubiquinone/menaquinone biosynthesis C-methylase UbiE